MTALRVVLQLHGYRRVFAHTADIFFVRGIARPGTREIASLSCEPWPAADASGAASEQQAQQAQQVRQQLVVSLFEVPFTPASVAAFIAREHEFRFLAVQPYELVSGQPTPQLAVRAWCAAAHASCLHVLRLSAVHTPCDISSLCDVSSRMWRRTRERPRAAVQVLCAANSDAHYRATRCPPDEWARRWGVHGVERVWRDDVLPCRVYLRHCVLAAQGFCDEAYASFLDATWLADRKTTVRQWLQQHPEIMQEEPPLELVDRYSG